MSYEKLAFHVYDSPIYRTFTRLSIEQMPRRSGLQSTIRQIAAQTLQQVNELLTTYWVDQGLLSKNALRIDSTAGLSNIHGSSDSQLLNNGIRVLSRMVAKCKNELGVRLRFTDPRKRSKSMAFRIFNSEKLEKQAATRGRSNSTTHLS